MSKKITLQEAHDVLTNCSAVIVDDTVVVYPGLNNELQHESTNEFLFLNWTDDEGNGYTISFNEGDNEEVEISGSYMFLKDTNGEIGKITILVPQKLD